MSLDFALYLLPGNEFWRTRDSPLHPESTEPNKAAPVSFDGAQIGSLV